MHSRKLKGDQCPLTTYDILVIGRDICSCLVKLHTHNPPLVGGRNDVGLYAKREMERITHFNEQVHGDLCLKNVLLDWFRNPETQKLQCTVRLTGYYKDMLFYAGSDFYTKCV